MNILVVGNIIKDIYLNLDGREKYELDKNGIKWLDLQFNASEYHFFSRMDNFGGAAVTLEVLERLGIEAAISGSSLSFSPKDEETDGNEKYLGGDETSDFAHRYILISDEQVCYLAPSKFKKAKFIEPEKPVDYIYVDRSAVVAEGVAKQILDYLSLVPETQLVVYAQNLLDHKQDELLARADLIFVENHGNQAVNPDAPTSHFTEMKDPALEKRLSEFDPEKLIYLSDTDISYLNIHEPLSMKRVDTMTHLSAYSIIAGTVLGCFVLGYSVEKSLKFARLNVENSKLNGSNDLAKLKEMVRSADNAGNLELIAANLVHAGKGILAADESGGSIHKKFEALNIPDNYDTRRDYRDLLLTTKDLADYVNGVILFDETARQEATNGQKFPDYLISQRIIPGVKVDEGLEKFDNSEETYTKGLDGLDKRLAEYYKMGLRFTKWRAAFTVSLDEEGKILTPSKKAVLENCRILAEYAKIVQKGGLVPIVEPEVVYDGDYPLEISAKVTGRILDELFKALLNQGVNLKACLLKVNMVLAGQKSPKPSTPEEVGKATSEVLKKHVPKALAGVVFLSGGQTPEQATANLAEIEKNAPFPWPVTFSFARALQGPALEAWAGDNKNLKEAQTAFLRRLKANKEALGDRT